MKKGTTLGCLAGLLFAAFAIFLLSGYPEGYCVFWPKIDTRYAEGFSEVAFKRLAVGVPWEEANRIMCPPLGITTNSNGTLSVSYTCDGNAPFGDFAWFARSLEISNGLISKVDRSMYMD